MIGPLEQILDSQVAGGGVGPVPPEALLYDDTTPVFYDDGNYVLTGD